MKPTAPLMIEHRLIDRMSKRLHAEHDRIRRDGSVNVGFLETAIHFFKTYVDEFHHGKEENLLFRAMDKKTLSDAHRSLLNELIEEHARSRTLVRRLDEMRKQQVDAAETEELMKNIQSLIQGYRIHIEKEDRHFFPAAMNYLSREEQDSMLEQSNEFDRKFMQQRYSRIVRTLEEKASGSKAA